MAEQKEKAAKIIMAWEAGKQEYRVVSTQRYKGAFSFTIEKKYFDALGDPAWLVETQNEDIDDVFKSLASVINSSRYRLVPSTEHHGRSDRSATFVFTVQEQEIVEEIWKEYLDYPWGNRFDAFCSLLLKMTGKSTQDLERE